MEYISHLWTRIFHRIVMGRKPYFSGPMMISTISICLFIWGCGGGSSSPGPPPDTIPPITSIVSCSPSPNASGWNNSNVACTLSSVDNSGGVGVAEIVYNITSQIIIRGDTTTVNFTGEGEITMLYFGVDNNGNHESPRSRTVKIDKTLPIINGTISPLPNFNGWNTTPVTVFFSCSDVPSGIATCPSSIPLLTEGKGQVVSASAVDKAANSMLGSVTINLDMTPPAVLSTIPFDKALEVDVNSPISVTFSEEMDPATLSLNTFTIKAGSVGVPGSVSISGKTATFTPSSSLAFATPYTATLTGSVRDVAGNPLTTYVWSFDTRGRSWGNPALIELNTSSAANPHVAMDASGNATTVWEQGGDVWANRFSRGSGWNSSLATRIEADFRPAANPKVAMDAVGNTIAVWEQNGNIWANRNAVGTVWSTNNAVLIEPNFGAATTPVVAMDTLGNGVAAWVQQGDTFLGSPDNRQAVWANRYSAGSGWSNTATDIRSTLGTASSPRVAMDASGNAIAVWIQDSKIRGNHNPAGSNWSRLNTTGVAASVTGVPSSLQVAMDSIGNALAVWLQDGDVYSNRYQAGQGWGTPALVELNAGVALNPKVAMDASGNAIAVWAQNTDIWANRYLVGQGWSPNNAQTIESTIGLGSNPKIAMDSNGNGIAVWQQGIDIMANRFEIGTGWGIATIIENSSEPGLSPQVAMDASGNSMVVWLQSDGTALSVWGNGYN